MSHISTSLIPRLELLRAEAVGRKRADTVHIAFRVTSTLCGVGSGLVARFSQFDNANLSPSTVRCPDCKSLYEALTSEERALLNI